MKLKSLLAALTLAAAGSAFAATDLGPLGAAPATFQRYHSPASSFIDYYTFSIVHPYDVNVFGSTFELDFFNLLNVNLASASLTGGGLSGALTDTNLNDGLSFTSLSAGAYTLALAGSVTGFFGGVYAGEIHAAPVPEPEHYAMMLTGLLMVGWSVRRRNAR